jgi:hypothetical protein
MQTQYLKVPYCDIFDLLGLDQLHLFIISKVIITKVNRKHQLYKYQILNIQISSQSVFKKFVYWIHIKFLHSTVDAESPDWSDTA